MLYRKYRPKNFAEIIGQKNVTQTLIGAIEKGHLSHAYLFTGPRGTGKTSIARILAKTINCEDSKVAITCEKCSNCKMIDEGKALDIIEIDAASNTGVDNIRELKETIALPPSKLKYKVYIIDEVHMLSTGAFNALLKTLEEPPAHVIFILATTEIHKVPETILSRCQRFDFSRLPIQNIVEKLTLIAKAEKIKIDQEALEMIAISAEGGMRDAETLFSQIISLEDKEVTAKEVEEILGTTQNQTVASIGKAILEKKSSLAIAQINELLDNGYDLAVFTKSLINYLRQIMLLKVDPELKKYFSYEATNEKIEAMLGLASKSDLIAITQAIDIFSEAKNKISAFMLPQLPLEMAVIKATGIIPASSQAVTSPEIIEEKPTAPPVKNIPPKKSPTEKAFEKTPEETEPKSDSLGKEVTLEEVTKNWSQLLIDIKPYNHSLGVLLTNCQAVATEGNKIILATPYEFYKEKLEIPSHRLTVEEVFGKILGLPILLKINIDKTILPKKSEEAEKKSQEEPKENGNLLDSALEIFGGKVVE